MAVRQPISADDFHARAERRIGRLTLILGSVASAALLILISPRAGFGVAVGTVLAWINYRWLEQATGVMVSVSTASRCAAPVRVPMGVYLRFAGRYIFIGLVVYTMVVCFALPILSLVGGLLALGAAAMAEGLYEVFTASE